MHTSEIEIEEEGECSDLKDTEGIPAQSDYIDIDGVEPNVEPFVGMEFKSVNEAWEFYKTFGKEIGFPVIKRASNKNVAGDTFTCARAGKRDSICQKPLQPRATIKCGCPAKLVLRLDSLNGYIISKIVLEHNHELMPENAKKIRCNRYVSVESCSKLIPTVTLFKMEKQMQGVYTLPKFREFQKELTSKMYCDLFKQEEDPVGTFKYVTRESMWIKGTGDLMIEKFMNFDVIFSSNDCEVSCSCKMFELKGMLCRHALTVLIRHGIEFVPEKYIKTRWRKDVKRGQVERDRYNDLIILFRQVAERASKSEAAYNDIMQWIVMKLEMLKNSEVVPKSPATNDCKEGEEKDSPEDEVVDTTVDDTVFDQKRERRQGRPQSSSYGNACSEQDGPVSGDVPTPTSKRRDRPPAPGSKNKKTTYSSGAGNVQVVQQQESNAVAPPAHMYQPNGVAPQVLMYQPWGFYGHPHPHYVRLPMVPNAMSYLHMQRSAPALPATAPNMQMFGGSAPALPATAPNMQMFGRSAPVLPPTAPNMQMFGRSAPVLPPTTPQLLQ